MASAGDWLRPGASVVPPIPLPKGQPFVSSVSQSVSQSVDTHRSSGLRMVTGSPGPGSFHPSKPVLCTGDSCEPWTPPVPVSGERHLAQQRGSNSRDCHPPLDTWWSFFKGSSLSSSQRVCLCTWAHL